MKFASLAIFVVGLILLIYGINASDSVSSNVSEAVTGTPTDRSIWLIVLGVIGLIAGGAGFFMNRRAH